MSVGGILSTGPVKTILADFLPSTINAPLNLISNGGLPIVLKTGAAQMTNSCNGMGFGGNTSWVAGEIWGQDVDTGVPRGALSFQPYNASGNYETLMTGTDRGTSLSATLSRASLTASANARLGITNVEPDLATANTSNGLTLYESLAYNGNLSTIGSQAMTRHALDVFYPTSNSSQDVIIETITPFGTRPYTKYAYSLPAYASTITLNGATAVSSFNERVTAASIIMPTVKTLSANLLGSSTFNIISKIGSNFVVRGGVGDTSVYDYLVIN